VRLLPASAVSEFKVNHQLRREESIPRNRIRTPEAPAPTSCTLQGTRRNLSMCIRSTAELIWLVSELLSHGVSSPTTYPRLRQRPTLGLPHPTVLRLQAFSASWRFIPPKPARPYFMPNPSVGLRLSEASPSQ
jgi:hypothetical protein